MSRTPLCIACSSPAYPSVSSSNSLLQVASCWKPPMTTLFKTGCPAVPVALSATLLLCSPPSAVHSLNKDSLPSLDVHCLCLLIRTYAPRRQGPLCVGACGGLAPSRQTSINDAERRCPRKNMSFSDEAGRRGRNQRTVEKGHLCNLFPGGVPLRRIKGDSHQTKTDKRG